MLNAWRIFVRRSFILLAVSVAIPSTGYPREQKSASASSVRDAARAAPKSEYEDFLKNVELLIKPLSEVIAMLAVLFAAFQYRQAVRTRHAEWLLSTFESFYQTAKYQRMRTLLDSPGSPKFIQLESDLKSLTDSPDVQRFDRYLNFFEFVAVLWRRGQLTRHEVCDLFEYYLKNLKGLSFVMFYIENQGFERLHQLLTTIRVTNKADQ